jgi:hypothetical protein
VGVGVSVAVAVAVDVTVAVAVALLVAVAVAVGLAVCVGVGVDVGVFDGGTGTGWLCTLTVSDAVSLAVLDSCTEPVLLTSACTTCVVGPPLSCGSDAAGAVTATTSLAPAPSALACAVATAPGEPAAGDEGGSTNSATSNPAPVGDWPRFWTVTLKVTVTPAVTGVPPIACAN